MGVRQCNRTAVLLYRSLLRIPSETFGEIFPMRAHYRHCPYPLVQVRTEHQSFAWIAHHFGAILAKQRWHKIVYHISPASNSCNILSACRNTSVRFQSVRVAICMRIASISSRVPEPVCRCMIESSRAFSITSHESRTFISRLRPRYRMIARLNRSFSVDGKDVRLTLSTL